MFVPFEICVWISWIFAKYSPYSVGHLMQKQRCRLKSTYYGWLDIHAFQIFRQKSLFHKTTFLTQINPINIFPNVAVSHHDKYNSAGSKEREVRQN